MSPSRDYIFTQFTTTSGLVSYQVNSIVQDREGFVWIGTNDGLQRFDGIRYNTFRHDDNDPSTLPADQISQLLIDNEKNLWVLTFDGHAGIFNTNTLKFSAVPVKVKNEHFNAAGAPSRKLIKDEFGNIFLLISGSELVTYNKRSTHFSPANNFPGLQQKLKIRAFAQQPGTRKYWLGTDDRGLGIYDDASGKLSFSGGNPENEPAIETLRDNRNITNLFFDKSKRLWLINNTPYSSSVSCYDLAKNALILQKYQFDTARLGFHNIRSFFEQQDGTIWITGQQIFARFLEKEKQFEKVYNGVDKEHGIHFVSITGLMEDRERNLWAGTGNNGIFRFNPSKDFFSNIGYTSHTTNKQGAGAPVAFLHQTDGTLLVGIRDDGLYRFDKNMQQVPLDIKGISNKNTTVIWAMCASSDSNTIWLAAEHGLYKYEQNKKTAVYLQPVTIGEILIRQIAEDKNGNLWLGMQDGGLFRWNPLKGKYKFEDGLMPFKDIPAVSINKIIMDRKGFLWVGTNANGAYMIEPETGKILKRFHLGASGVLNLPERSVNTLLDYNDSLLVICTNTRLVVYNRLQQTSYVLGAPVSGFITSIEKDNNGHMWVSTTTSLYRVTISNKVLLQLNRDDGMANDAFLPGASYTLPDKRMLFGVYGVIISFMPAQIKTNLTYPDLKITDFMVKDKYLRVDSLLRKKVIVLSPEENAMTIDLSVLSYNSGYLLKYKLEGLDKEWKSINQNYQLVYSYLPPGNYTLYVRSYDADGVKGEKTISLSIRVSPPFWRTWWFYSVILLLVVMCVFWFEQLRTKRRQAVQKMRSNIAGNLHREVNIALNNINILSEMAKLKADNNPEKSKEFINQINIKSENMIIAMDDMLWSIDPANDNIQKTVERLREYSEALNNRHNAGIEILVDKNVAKLKLDMQLRHEALLLFKECLNAQVMCGARDIKVHISYEKSNVVYSTQFHPVPCNIKQLHNLLHSKEMGKRLKAIGAKLSLDENKSNLLVLLKLPVSF